MTDNSEDFNAMVARDRLRRTKSQSVPEQDNTLQRQTSIDDRPRIEAYSDSDSDVESHIQRVQQIRPPGANQQAFSDAEFANQEALQSVEGTSSTAAASSTIPSSSSTTAAAAATAGSALTNLAGSLFNKFFTPAMLTRLGVLLAIQRSVPPSKKDGTDKAIDIAALVIPTARFILLALLGRRKGGIDTTDSGTDTTTTTSISRVTSIANSTGTQIVKVGEVAGLIAITRRLYNWQQQQRALRRRNSRTRELRRSSSVSMEVLEAAAHMRTLPPKPPETAAEWAAEFAPEIKEMQRIIMQCQIHLPSARFQQPALPAELLRYAKTCGLLTAKTTADRAAAVEAAVRQVIETSDWLAQQQQQRPPMRVLKKYNRLISWKGADASGRPILLVRAGRAVQLVKSSRLNEFVQVILTYVDQGVNDLMSEQPYPPPPSSIVSDINEQEEGAAAAAAAPRSQRSSADMDPQGRNNKARNSKEFSRLAASASASSVGTAGGGHMGGSASNSTRNSVEINSSTSTAVPGAGDGIGIGSSSSIIAGLGTAGGEGSSLDGEQQQQQQPTNEKMVVVVDCRGSSNWSAAKHLQMVKRLALDLNAHYPDRLHKLILIDIPMMGKLMIQQIVPSLNPLTKDKIVHRSADDPDLPVTVAILATRRSMGLVGASSGGGGGGGGGLHRTLSDISFGGSSTGTASPTTAGAGAVAAGALAEELERQQGERGGQGGGAGEDSFISEEDEWQTPGGGPSSMYVSANASQEPSAFSLPMTPSFVAQLSPEPSGAIQDPSSHTLLVSSMSVGTLAMVSSDDLGSNTAAAAAAAAAAGGGGTAGLQVPPGDVEHEHGGDDTYDKQGPEGMGIERPPSPRVHRIASLASSMCSYGGSSGCASPVLSAPLSREGGAGGGGGSGELPVYSGAAAADDDDDDDSAAAAAGTNVLPPLPPQSGSPTKKGLGGAFSGLGVGKRWQKGGTPAKSSLRRTISEEAIVERKAAAAAAAAAAAGGGGGDKGGGGGGVESYSLGRQSSVSWAQKLESVKEIDRHSQEYGREGGK